MAFFVQLGQNISGADGITVKRIKKTGNRFGGESGSKGGYGAGLVYERRARRKKLERLMLTEGMDEVQQRRR
jgi:hypothetical protein